MLRLADAVQDPASVVKSTCRSGSPIHRDFAPALTVTGAVLSAGSGAGAGHTGDLQVDEKNATAYCVGAWTLAGLVIFTGLVMGGVYGSETLLSFAIPAMGSFIWRLYGHAQFQAVTPSSAHAL